jgi:NOL1/NOP2/fmu family ribosome biogenesis protein
MFRKDEEARIEWSLESVAFCATRQIEILEAAATMLKPSGTLVYSTCTFSPEENESVIDQFLTRHPEWRIQPIPHKPGYEAGRPYWTGSGNPYLEQAVRLLPNRLRGEGLFIACLVKHGEEPSNYLNPTTKKAKKDIELFASIPMVNTFIKEHTHLPSDWIQEERLIRFGTHLYLLPDEHFPLHNLKIVRAGLHLGEIKKNRFEPSHSLAIALKLEDFKEFLNLSLEQRELTSYLKGETLQVDSAVKGWVGVLVDGFPLGWGKASGGIVKNHFPKGLRWL